MPQENNCWRCPRWGRRAGGVLMNLYWGVILYPRYSKMQIKLTRPFRSSRASLNSHFNRAIKVPPSKPPSHHRASQIGSKYCSAPPKLWTDQPGQSAVDRNRRTDFTVCTISMYDFSVDERIADFHRMISAFAKHVLREFPL